MVPETCEVDVSEQEPKNSTGPNGIQLYRTFRDLAGEILAAGDREGMLARCATILHELLPIDVCSVALLDTQTQTLTPLLTMAADGRTDRAPAALPLALTGDRMAEAIKAGRPLIVGRNALLDGESPLLLQAAQSLLTAVLLPIPIGDDGVSGILWLGRVHGAPFTPDEQELAEAIASLMALALRGDAATP